MVPIMRIAIVQRSFYTPGGAERVLDQLIRQLASRHEFALFTFDYQTMNFQHLDAAKRFVIKPPKPVLGRLRRYRDAKRYRLLGRAINQWHPDVVLLNKDINLAEWMSSTVDVPVVPYLHGYVDLSYRLTPIESSTTAVHNFDANPLRLYRRLAGEPNPSSARPGKCKAVICVSDSTAAQLGKYWPNMNTFVVRNGVDHSSFFPTWKDQGYALCISRLVPQKNLEFLVNVFRSADYPLIIHGIIEAGARHSQDYLRQLESLKGPRTRIVTHQNEDSMIELLQRSSIFLHPGRDEGFPLAPLEAMACGKVVVGHDSGGTPELINDHGFLAGDDESQWVTIVNRLMGSAPLRTGLGRSAYEYSKNFSWEKTSAEFETALDSVV
jgi:glycosyltransferase involved in cell wall biosynthesis